MSTEDFLPDAQTFNSLGALPDDQPVVMLNLLKFPGDAGVSYAGYGRIALPQILKRGGQILYAGEPVFDDPQAGHWDRVILVYYPSRASFLDMMADPDYQRGLPHRRAGLEKTVLYAFHQSDNPMAPPLEPVVVEGGDEIFVLNLMRFKAQGRAEYQKYSQVVMPMVLERGGRPAYLLDAELPLVADQSWEDLYLVRYPNVESLQEMVATQAWQTANADRQRGLDLTWAFPTRPLG